MVISCIKLLGMIVGSAAVADVASHIGEPLGRSTAVEIGAACAIGMVLITTTVWLVGGRQRLIDGQKFQKELIEQHSRYVHEQMDAINKRLDGLLCNSPERICAVVRQYAVEESLPSNHRKERP